MQSVRPVRDVSLVVHKSLITNSFVVSTVELTSRKLLLRSYYTQAANQDTYECTVWQAARATSAAPLYFRPFKLERPHQEILVLCDGGLNTSTINNPIFEVMNEANRLDPQRGIGCVVSIGTGRTDSSRMGSKGHQVLKNCVAIATHCHEKYEQYVAGTEGSRLRRSDQFFRFDPETRIGDIALDDRRELWNLETFMSSDYLSSDNFDRDVNKCAEKLC